ncbi:MAG: hypothetical protein M0027_02775 [Candidatus Dormibacteraeota bacterium]|nr:hypothetical protein [Candidatus Dormibacteraeota bacterium]
MQDSFRRDRFPAWWTELPRRWRQAPVVVEEPGWVASPPGHGRTRELRGAAVGVASLSSVAPAAGMLG